MSVLRVTIGTLAVCVLLLAVDFTVLRRFPKSEAGWLNLFALPMANLLVLAFHQGRTRRRLGSPSPFLRGFQVVGWLVLIGYLVGCRLDGAELSWTLAAASERVFWLTLDNLSFDAMKSLDPSFRLAAHIAKAAQGLAAATVVSGLMLVPAVLGGLAARRWQRGRAEPALAPQARDH